MKLSLLFLTAVAGKDTHLSNVLGGDAMDDDHEFSTRGNIKSQEKEAHDHGGESLYQGREESRRGAPIPGQIHKITSTEFNRINTALDDSTRFSNQDIFEHIMGRPQTTFPTLFPAQVPIRSESDQILPCIPWEPKDGEVQWKMEKNNNVVDWTTCSHSCGGGIKKSYTTYVQPNLDLFPGREICDEPEGMDRETHQVEKTEPCNPDPCPVDCVLFPLDGQWQPNGVNTQGEVIMQQIRGIDVHDDNGGKPCPTESERTITKTWHQHCESHMNVGTKVDNWGSCNEEGRKTRSTTKRTCFKEKAALMEMTYKESKRCDSVENPNHSVSQTEKFGTSHWISATGASE